MKKKESGRVLAVQAQPERTHTRLSALGFVPGAWVELVHEAPFWRDPIAVKIRNSLIALRRKDAEQILVEVPSGN